MSPEPGVLCWSLLRYTKPRSQLVPAQPARPPVRAVAVGPHSWTGLPRAAHHHLRTRERQAQIRQYRRARNLAVGPGHCPAALLCPPPYRDEVEVLPGQSSTSWSAA